METTDNFSNQLLTYLNAIYQIDDTKKFSLIKKKGNVYAFGYEKLEYSPELPNEGGDIAIAWPEKNIILVDKNCIEPISKECLQKNNRWEDKFEDIDLRKAFACSSEIISQLVKAGY
jgi:hypothetical protein